MIFAAIEVVAAVIIFLLFAVSGLGSVLYASRMVVRDRPKALHYVLYAVFSVAGIGMMLVAAWGAWRDVARLIAGR